MKTTNLSGLVFNPDNAYINSDWKHYSMSPHAHGWLELNYIVEGSCTYLVNDVPYDLSCRNLLVLDSSLPHRKIFHPDTPCTVLGASFTMQEGIIGLADADILLHKDPAAQRFWSLFTAARVLPDGRSIYADLLNLYEIFCNEESSFYLTCATAKLLMDIPRLFTQYDTNRIDYIRQIKLYIQYHYSKIRSVAEIAEHVNLNPTYMERIFKKCTGNTIWQYLTSLRLEAAKNLLTHSDISIGEIDTVIGMGSRQSFYIQFKKKYGISPADYRQAHRPPVS